MLSHNTPVNCMRVTVRPGLPESEKLDQFILEDDLMMAAASNDKNRVKALPNSTEQTDRQTALERLTQFGAWSCSAKLTSEKLLKKSKGNY